MNLDIYNSFGEIVFSNCIQSFSLPFRINTDIFFNGTYLIKLNYLTIRFTISKRSNTFTMLIPQMLYNCINKWTPTVRRSLFWVFLLLLIWLLGISNLHDMLRNCWNIIVSITLQILFNSLDVTNIRLIAFSSWMHIWSRTLGICTHTLGICTRTFHICLRTFHICTRTFHICTRTFHICLRTLGICTRTFHIFSKKTLYSSSFTCINSNILHFKNTMFYINIALNEIFGSLDERCNDNHLNYRNIYLLCIIKYINCSIIDLHPKYINLLRKYIYLGRCS